MDSQDGVLREREVLLLAARELLHALLRARQDADVVFRLRDGLAEGRREPLDLRLLVLQQGDRVHHARALAFELRILHAQALLVPLVLLARLGDQRREPLLELGGPRGNLGVEPGSLRDLRVELVEVEVRA